MTPRFNAGDGGRASDAEPFQRFPWSARLKRKPLKRFGGGRRAGPLPRVETRGHELVIPNRTFPRFRERHACREKVLVHLEDERSLSRNCLFSV